VRQVSTVISPIVVVTSLRLVF